jgi:hypothetical protein
VELIRAAEAVASGQVPPPSGSSLIRELRAEIRVAHKEKDQLLARIERLENEINEQGGRQAGPERPSTHRNASVMDDMDDIYDASPVEANQRDDTGNSGAVGDQPNTANPATDGHTTQSQTPVPYSTLPTQDPRVETLRDEPQQLTTTGSDHATSTAAELNTTTSPTPLGSLPAQSGVNAAVSAAETQRPARVSFMSPPRNGYTSSIPQIRLQENTAPTVESPTNSESSEEL